MKTRQQFTPLKGFSVSTRFCLVPVSIIATFILGTILPAARGDSSDVSYIQIFKTTYFLQTGTGDPILENNPFAGEIDIAASTPGSILAASFAPPGGNFIALDKNAAGNILYFAKFATQSERDAAFPAGPYFFDMLTATSPSEFTPRVEVADRFPNVPKLSNLNWYSVVLQLDVNKPFTFSWNNFIGFQTGGSQPSAIRFQIVDVFTQAVYTRDFLNPTTEVTLPAGTLSRDQLYIGRIEFINFLQGQDGFTSLFSYSLYTTEFIISAIDGPPVIQEPLNITVNSGELFIYVIDATNTPGSFTVTGLPPGVDYDADYGLIGGFPTRAGTTPIQMSATNSVGTGPAATLNLTVLGPSGLAIISSTTAAGSKNDPFNFQVLTTGGTPAARLSATGLPPGLTVDSVTGLISGKATASGKFPVMLTVVDTNATATGTLELTFNADPAFPNITSPTTATVSSGKSFSYTIKSEADSGSAGSTTYKIIGQLPAGLTFDSKTGTISGSYIGNAPTGRTSPDQPNLSGGIVSNVQLFATNPHGTATIPLIFFVAPTGAVNISTRLAVGTGDVLIAGFIVTGNAPKKVVIRAIGPSSHVPGAMQDPTLELHDATTTLGFNDNWRDSQENEINGTGIPPTDERESAILAYLNPGNYTAVVRGKNNSTGIAVVEVYDLGTASLDSSSTAKLAQISTRGTVLTGDDVMIGGFIVQQQATKVIVRAIGPSLTSILPNALQDTVLELHDGSGSTIASNDDWRSDQEQQIKDTTVPPTNDRESAIVATLSPGAYTAIVRGKDNTTGVGLVEVYSLQ